MTVGELIKELEKLPKDLRVFTVGYEGGYVDPDVGKPRTFILDVNTAWYYGPHEEADSWIVEENPSKEIVLGVTIS